MDKTTPRKRNLKAKGTPKANLDLSNQDRRSRKERLGSNSSRGSQTRNKNLGKSNSKPSNKVEKSTVSDVRVHEFKTELANGFDVDLKIEKDQFEQQLEDNFKEFKTKVMAIADDMHSKAVLSNDKLLKISEKRESKTIFSEKVFENRDSLLTESTKKGKEAHTVFNIFVSVLLLIFLKMFCHDVFTKGYWFMDLSIMVDVVMDIEVLLYFWLPNFLLTFTIVFLVKLTEKLNLTYHVHVPIYAVIQLFTFGVPIHATIYYTDNLMVSMILTCEMARFAMKIHAYYREKLLYGRENKHRYFVPEFAKKRGVTLEDLNIPNITIEDIITELRRFNFFLWIPTLVYRDEYPMRPKRDFRQLLTHLMTFNFSFYYTFALIKGFVSPAFIAYFAKECTLEDLITVATGTGVLFLAIAFFGVLHSWMNIFAEITRFADRQFYTDWWNVSNFGAYYRKWNIIVHEFLLYYVYNDFIRLSKGRFSGGLAKFMVFFISAVVHEIIIACTFDFVYPILLVMFGGPGVIFMMMTKSNNRVLGISFWFFLIIGNGMLIIFYGLEYYTRQQPSVINEVNEGGLIMYFIPQTFSYLSKMQ